MVAQRMKRERGLECRGKAARVGEEGKREPDAALYGYENTRIRDTEGVSCAAGGSESNTDRPNALHLQFCFVLLRIWKTVRG